MGAASGWRWMVAALAAVTSSGCLLLGYVDGLSQADQLAGTWVFDPGSISTMDCANDGVTQDSIQGRELRLVRDSSDSDLQWDYPQGCLLPMTVVTNAAYVQDDVKCTSSGLFTDLVITPSQGTFTLDSPEALTVEAAKVRWQYTLLGSNLDCAETIDGTLHRQQ